MARIRPVPAALLAFALLFPLAVTLAAHHGWGEYDSRKSLTLSGIVRDAGYENPHAFVDLDVDGKVWHAVLAPPNRMEARGVTRGQLGIGTTVTVIGFPHKTRSTEMKAEQIKVGEKTTWIR